MFSATLQPGVELRLLEERHARPLFGRINREREYLRQWLPWVDATQGEDDVLAFIRRVQQRFASNEGLSAGIWVDGAMAGNIGLHHLDWLSRKAEIGYWLAREFQGRGIMTAAVKTITAHALVELDLNRIAILCACGNTKSAAIPKRLGFTFEGVLREAEALSGRFVDVEVYSMLRGEYRP